MNEWTSRKDSLELIVYSIILIKSIILIYTNGNGNSSCRQLAIWKHVESYVADWSRSSSTIDRFNARKKFVFRDHRRLVLACL